MAVAGLLQENIWTERATYYEAECAFYQQASKARLTPLAEEIAKARKRLIEVIAKDPQSEVLAVDTGAVKFLEKKVVEMSNLLNTMQQQLSSFESRLSALEQRACGAPPVCTKGLMVCPRKPSEPVPAPMEEDDDVDLFGSDSEDDETANKVREERLAAYNEKKSKKVAIIAKSSVVLDIKPWEDTTDMKLMEQKVRAIVMDGLLWGAAKLVPLAYGIRKLQISAVVEDDKVSIDELQDQIEDIDELVQSMDIAAFNKI